jgi:hypothetical protein
MRVTDPWKRMKVKIDAKKMAKRLEASRKDFLPDFGARSKERGETRVICEPVRFDFMQIDPDGMQIGSVEYQGTIATFRWKPGAFDVAPEVGYRITAKIADEPIRSVAETYYPLDVIEIVPVWNVAKETEGGIIYTKIEVA